MMHGWLGDPSDRANTTGSCGQSLNLLLYIVASSKEVLVCGGHRTTPTAASTEQDTILVFHRSAGDTTPSSASRSISLRFWPFPNKDYSVSLLLCAFVDGMPKRQPVLCCTRVLRRRRAVDALETLVLSVVPGYATTQTSLPGCELGGVLSFSSLSACNS